MSASNQFKEKFFNALWSGAGMLFILIASTVWENKLAIAQNTSQLSEQQEISMKIDTIINAQTNIETNVLLLTNNVKSLDAKVQNTTQEQIKQRNTLVCQFAVKDTEPDVAEKRKACFDRLSLTDNVEPVANTQDYPSTEVTAQNNIHNPLN